MSFFSALQSKAMEGYTALQGTQGQPQSAADIIQKLVDRLQNSTLQEDRRSSVLGIKGMARDWKADVGRLALPALLDILYREDLTDDTDMAKAVLETLHVLCEVEESENGKIAKGDTGVANVDVFLRSPDPTHALLVLLSLPHFYIRFFSLQLFGTLLSAPAPRPQTLQSYLLIAPGGLGAILSILDDNREIIRNEALLLLISITSTNADIQKIVAFEGAFERLFRIVDIEGGIGGGGIVVQDCLSCVASLLRYNVSNQNYFRETSCVPHLAPMLLFPPSHDPPLQALDAFAFQPWTAQKATNAALVISLARTLVSGAGSGKAANQKAMLTGGLTRCLIELALASAAPWGLKSEALHALASIVKGSKANQDLLGSLVIQPLAVTLGTVASSETPGIEHGNADVGPAPRPSTSSDRDSPNEGAEAYRLGAQSSILALISLALSGPPGLDPSDIRFRHQREVTRLRAGAVYLFEAYVTGNPDAQMGVVGTMTLPPDDNPNAAAPMQPHSAGSLLLSVMRTLPVGVPGLGFDSYTPFFACLMFAHLLRGSETAKQKAREIVSSGELEEKSGIPDDDDDDEKTGLIHTLVGNVMMAQRAQAQGTNAGEGQARGLEWARVMVGYLIALSMWLWESPKSVKDFLSEGANLQVLLEPASQASGVDPLVQGLCAFLLGVCYEYDWEPDSAIPRATFQPILHSRVGPDQFVNRILRLREDARFKNTGPETMEMNEPPSEDEDADDGLWFDWAFVEFFKNNYLSIQKAILVEPGATSDARPAVDNSQTDELVARLKAEITAQARDIEALQRHLSDIEHKHEEERQTFSKTTESLTEQVSSLKAELSSSSTAQEDLLVLLEELTGKRQKDKARMREKGLEVSDDDEDEGDDDDEE